MQRCIDNAECSAITYKEGVGGCGIHEGAIEIFPNSDSGVWPTGYVCYAKQGKFAKQSFLSLQFNIIFKKYLVRAYFLFEFL